MRKSSRLNATACQSLVAKVTPNEVDVILHDINDDKARGQDSFNTYLYSKKVCHILKGGV